VTGKAPSCDGYSNVPCGCSESSTGEVTVTVCPP
jgi:hypothetical protein